MSEHTDAIDAALCQEIVKDVIEMQIMNLTKLNTLDVEATGEVRGILATFARRAAVACHRGDVPKPSLTSIQNSNFANHVERALTENGIDALISTTHAALRTANPGRPLAKDVQRYAHCYFKIAIYASQVSWMIRHELHPDILSMSKKDMSQHFAKLRTIALEAGIPVITNKTHRRH